MNKKTVKIITFFAIFLLFWGFYLLGVFKDTSFLWVVNRLEKPYEIVLNKLFSGDDLTRIKFDLFIERKLENKDDFSLKWNLNYNSKPLDIAVNGKLKYREYDSEAWLYNAKIPGLPFDFHFTDRWEKSLKLAGYRLFDLDNYSLDYDKNKVILSILSQLSAQLKEWTIFELNEDLSDRRYFRYKVSLVENIYSNIKSMALYRGISNEFILEILKSDENIYSIKNRNFSIISDKKWIKFKFFWDDLFNLKRKWLTNFVLEFNREVSIFNYFKFKEIEINFTFWKTILRTEFDNKYFSKLILENKKTIK